MVRSVCSRYLSTALVFAAACLAATISAEADWYPADLPYRDYLSEPVTGIAAAGTSDVWAVSTYAYAFQDDQHVRWNSVLYHSRNDGLLWDLPFDAPASQTDPVPNQYQFQDTQLYAVSFADQDNGWLFGWLRPTFGLNDNPGAYVFYHTTDRGKTWTVSTLPNTETTPDEPDFAMDAVDATHCYAVQGRHVFETTDGVNWTERAGVYPRLFSVQAKGLMTPRATGTEAGSGVAGSLSLFAYFQDVSIQGELRAIRFADESTGWTAGRTGGNGVILGTTDGGSTWLSQFTAPNVLFRGLAVTAPTSAWVVGQTTGERSFGVVYRTEDSGAHWVPDGNMPGRLFAVAFRDSLHGWAAGEGGVWRYVPTQAVTPEDVDGSGKIDVLDIASLLRRAAGLEASSPATITPYPVLLTTALTAFKTLAMTPESPLQDLPSRVVIVYNTVSPDTDGNGVGDSRQIAEHYAAVRGVPSGNLIAVTWADTESFQNHSTADGAGRANWTDAYSTIVQPLQQKIDGVGRTSVDTILFCAGVPYTFRVAAFDGSWEILPLDTSIIDLYRCDEGNWSSGSPWYAPNAGATVRYGRNRFETGLRPMGQPVVGATGAVTRDPYYLVSRIDGPSLDACLAMIDNAVFAERYRGPAGYEGTAYIDSRAELLHGAPYSLDFLREFVPDYYGYSGIDASISRTILTFNDRGLPWRDEITNSRIGDAASSTGPFWRNGTPASSAPGAMFYAGWYNYANYNDVWDWLPGSVAVDYDSASAFNFRGASYFAGGALGHGLTALVGVLSEPYSYHPKTDVLMEYLARGYNFAEAAMLGTDTPRTARAIFLGDPLYRPFKPHPPEVVPVPALAVTRDANAEGWTVSLATDIPVKAEIRYTIDGAVPGPGSLTVPVAPAFYALIHRWALPRVTSVKYIINATDPTGRVTTSRVFTIP